MKLYFLRHGIADWPNWTKSDDERPLTEKGRKETRKVAKLLAGLKVEATILTSPLPRASQTAEIAGEVLDLKVSEEKRLRPGFDAAKLAKILRDCSDENVMVVGHEPDFTETISTLTGGTTKLSKTGVAMVELDRDSMKGRLLWLLPPRIAKV